jgi:hypothetical protein
VIAAIAALAFSTTAAQAASKDAPKGPPAISKDQMQKGMKEAPPLVAGAGVACTISDAAFLGTSEEKVEGKTVKSNIYEVACQGAVGQILIAKGGDKPQAFDCIATLGSSLACRLPGNSNPASALQPVVDKSGRTCQIANVKYIGTSPSAGITRYEVGCAAGPGFILDAPLPNSTAQIGTIPCLKAESAQITCTFTPKEAAVAELVNLAQTQPAAKDCKINNARWVTTDPSKNTEYYELGCDAGKPGFMAEVASNGSFVRSLSCAQAQGIAGGCSMTDVNTAQTAESGTYTKLAKAAGYQCDVSNYRALGVDQASKAEVVEIACSNRPDGAIAYFPTDAGGKAKFWNCVRAVARGLNCRLTKEDTAYPNLTQALVSKGRTQCKVSGARNIGMSQDKTEYIETACADGLPGFVIAFDGESDNVKELLTCGQASGLGGGCKLPTNIAKK